MLTAKQTKARRLKSKKQDAEIKRLVKSITHMRKILKIKQKKRKK